jgi:hypothetical protein
MATAVALLRTKDLYDIKKCNETNEIVYGIKYDCCLLFS